MSYCCLGEMQIPSGFPRVGEYAFAPSTEDARRKLLDPLVAQYRDRIAVNLNGRLEAAESVLDASGYRTEAMKYGLSAEPKPFYEAMPAEVKNLLILVRSYKAQAEEALNTFTREARKIVPKEVSALNLAVPSEWAIVNTRDELSRAGLKADSILKKWFWNERDQLTLSETMQQKYENVITPPGGMSWKSIVLWAAGMYFAANLIGAMRR